MGVSGGKGEDPASPTTSQDAAAGSPNPDEPEEPEEKGNYIDDSLRIEG